MYAIESETNGYVYKYVNTPKEAETFIQGCGEVADLLSLTYRKVNE